MAKGVNRNPGSDKLSKAYADEVCGRLNEILSEKPVQDAPADAEYQELYESLSESPWRIIVDSFEKFRGQFYGRARVVSADSADYIRIMGKR